MYKSEQQRKRDILKFKMMIITVQLLSNTKIVINFMRTKYTTNAKTSAQNKTHIESLKNAFRQRCCHHQEQ